MQVLNKVMEDAQRKANTHIVLNFDQCNTLFLVQETINPREVRLTENFMVKLDKRWCDYGKFQKLHMPCSNVGVACKHAHYEYRNYIHLMYTFQSVSNIYIGLFGELGNKAYWLPCPKPIICPDPKKK